MNISYVMLELLLIICIISSITDIRWGKIYNKYLGWTFIPGSAIVIFYYIQNKDFIVPFLINLSGAGLMSILFFRFKIWGAGDSKLWLMICYLFPYGFYVTKDYLLFPSFYILFFIFLLSYFYVLGETFILNIGRQHKLKEPCNIYRPERKRFQVNKQVLFDSFFCFFQLKIFYRVCTILFKNYYLGNYFFFALLGLLLTIAVLRTDIKKIYKSLVILIGCGLFLADFTGFAERKMFHIEDLIAILISVAVIFIRRGMAKYNYEEVFVKDVTKGMILSIITVIEFKKSRVKGLPQYTDESTKYRLTEEEVQAIKRWEKSKQGKSSIMVVKYLPFAIFMCLGVIIYIIWSSR